jgi:peptide/nickel transport system permease protein
MSESRLKRTFRTARQRFTKRYLAVRIGDLIVVFLAILLINFLLPRLMPGNFAVIFAHQLVQTRHGLNYQVVLQTIEKQFNLGAPVYSQFVSYLQQILSLAPNFGSSFEYYPTPAWTVVLNALKWTLLLLGLSQVIAWTIGLFLGVYLALKKNSWIDRFFQPFLFFIDSIPGFWIGMMFIFVFAIKLRWFPASQAYGVDATPLSILIHLVLPIVVIIIYTFPPHVLVTRATAIEILGSDFVQLTKAQGLSHRRLLIRILRNCMLPSVTRIFLTVGTLIGGIITIEFTFSYPGMGTVIGDAVLNEDYPVLQAALYLASLVVLLANLAADLIYPFLDPRVSYSGAGQGGG